MCIIAYKPHGVKLMKESVVKTCMENNKDGSGYMFNIKEGVVCRKGFNNSSKLMNTLHEDLKFYKVKEKDVAIAIHCRIGTAGLIKPENCHPFPITKNIGHLQSLFAVTERAMMHNGMLDIMDDKLPNLSDTQIFVRNILSCVDLNSAGVDLLIKMAIGSSKVILFDKDGLSHSYGKWEQEDGIFYSNTTYKQSHYGYLSQKKYSWDDEWAWFGSTATSLGNKSKSSETCFFCGVGLNKHNTAKLTAEEKEIFDIPLSESCCDWCIDWCIRNMEVKR